LDPSPKVMKIKTKINKWGLGKLKSFCTEKETTNKTKRQYPEWEKIFANDVTYRGLIFKIYKQLIELNKNKQLNQKRAEKLNRHFSKEDIKVAKAQEKILNITNYESKNVSHLVMFSSLQLQGLWPSRLLCPWDSLGKDNGVGCHFLSRASS